MGGKSSKNKKSKEEAPTAPLDVLVEGAIVFLTSKASGKLLRVHEGNIDVSAAIELHVFVRRLLSVLM